ncbi:MAG: hypothetical protein ACT4N2_03300 [Hyphomicrobium sp.]
MTAQSPERIIIDGRPFPLYSEPLYRLLKSRRMELSNKSVGWSTGCYRGYCGTWEVIDGRLHLIHLNTMWPDEAPLPTSLRERILRALPATGFPAFAYWFNGRLRLPLGRRLVYSHHGWSSWFERERVMTFAQGVLVRDRVVDTQRILEWWLKRHPETRSFLDGSDGASPAPLVWFDDSEQEDWWIDWWPPDFRRAAV